MTLNTQSKLVFVSMGVAITMTLLWQPVSSHGRLVEPPARSTMWRYGFSTPVNYQDNELFCGGFNHQMSQGYKCGICGDPWDSDRPHEAGGIYATGTIAAIYNQGEEIIIGVDLTVNHKGWFEFKLCPTNDYQVKATQECLDIYPLQLSDGSGTKLAVTDMGSTVINIPVVLPSNLSCEFCVLQWHYHAGNSWGTDPDGYSCTGCGPQEEFYGCADVVISPNLQSTSAEPPAITNGDAPGSSSDNPTPTANPTPTGTKKPTIYPATDLPPTAHGATTPIIENTVPTDSSRSGFPYILICRALIFIPGLQEWCDTNCNLNYCPSSHCECESVPEPRALESANLPPGCYARSPFVNWPGIEDWCSVNCPLGICHDNRCFCKY